jgi:hypothetical protein
MVIGCSTDAFDDDFGTAHSFRSLSATVMCGWAGRVTPGAISSDKTVRDNVCCSTV